MPKTLDRKYRGGARTPSFFQKIIRDEKSSGRHSSGRKSSGRRSSGRKSGRRSSG